MEMQSLDDAINNAKLILPGHKKEFFEILKNFPNDIERWLFNESVADKESLYQGDIVLDLPVCFVWNNGKIKKGAKNVILVSNTCDMQPNRHNFIVVSPFIPIQKHKEKLSRISPNSPNKVESNLADIRKNKVFSSFYIPANNCIEEGFIDFTQMISIGSSYLNEIKKGGTASCPISLSVNGRYLFLIKLLFHIARQKPQN
jgi:hypothetical protein